MQDFASVTEQPGTDVTPEALRMVVTRYHVAAQEAADADVLELAAGRSLGYGWLRRKARRVVATDIVPALVRESRRAVGPGGDLAVADAQRLPFEARSFDLVVCYEALYYVPDVDEFVRECRRVLRPGGRLLLCTANKRRQGFVRSPYSRAYHDAAELRALLARHGLRDVRVHGAFHADPPSLKQRALLWGFSTADRVGLIPRTLEGRARVKRLLYRNLVPLPPQVSPETAEPEPLVELDPADDADSWKVLYASGVSP